MIANSDVIATNKHSYTNTNPDPRQRSNQEVSDNNQKDVAETPVHVHKTRIENTLRVVLQNPK